MLGELYKPKGLALETAQVVFEDENPYACNVALGCLNHCAYCYVSKVTKTTAFRLPQKRPVDLVRAQLEKMPLNEHPKNVFLSFLTDPFLPQCLIATKELSCFLIDQGIGVATLSKLDTLEWYSLHGMSVVSLNDEYWKQFEPNALAPIDRLHRLHEQMRHGERTFVSMEPYPPSIIYKQDINRLLEELAWTGVNLIIFGKLNYDKRANTEQARKDYTENVNTLRDFCKENGIRLHIKSDTLKFLGVD